MEVSCCRSALELPASATASLLAFADPSRVEDVRAVAGAAQIILSTHDNAGACWPLLTCIRLCTACQHIIDKDDTLNHNRGVACAGNLTFVMEGTSGSVEFARVLIRTKRLLSFVLKAFVAHSSSFVNSANTLTPSIWSKLLDLACKLTGMQPYRLCLLVNNLLLCLRSQISCNHTQITCMHSARGKPHHVCHCLVYGITCLAYHVDSL